MADEIIWITDADSWLDLRVGETAVAKGQLENISPAETADSIVLTFGDWSQLVIDIPAGRPIELKDASFEGKLVYARVERTEDGVRARGVWMKGSVPVAYSPEMYR